MSRPGADTAHSTTFGFPQNAWYAAAWDHEVGRNLLPNTIAGKPIVFYRTTAGRPRRRVRRSRRAARTAGRRA